MSSCNQKIFKFVALSLIFCVSQIGVWANVPNNSAPAPDRLVLTPQVDLSGRLTTSGNRPISLNGNDAANGTTVLPGAQIVTPAQTGATIQIQGVGQLDIAPNANLTLTFSQGEMRVTLVNGCIILRVNEGVRGEVVTPQGTTEQTDPSRLTVDVCSDATGPAVVNQGAAASAGAGAGATGATTAGTVAASTGAVSGGLFGIGGAATAALLIAAAGAATFIILSIRGGDPSPTVP